MREICMSDSMSGVWKRSHGRASEAPPNERGGNRYVRPTATAPHLDSTEDSSLPPVGRAAGIVKGFRTPAGHGRDEMRGGRRPKSLGGGNRGGCAPAIDECGGLPHFGHCEAQPDRFRWGERDEDTSLLIEPHVLKPP